MCVCVDARASEQANDRDEKGQGMGEGGASPQNSWQAVKNDIVGGDFK